MPEDSNPKAPFPYFGGKSAVAADVWAALGQPKHYIEPFFGSGAVLLARPDFMPGKHIESVNDKDGFLCNVWRALQKAPDEVARWCDWPVNHAELSARKARLIAEEPNLLAALIADDEYCNPKMAGYWIWAASCWIGAGLTCPGQRPHISDDGRGVHELGQIPHISDGGRGVHATGQIPHIGDGGAGVQEPYNTNTYAWFRALSERLRYVRVVCGDWSRVCGGDWQDKHGTCGIFLDPPYGVEDRKQNIYHQDDTTVAAQAAADWVLARGDWPSYRIVLAGYYEEHERLLAHGWRAKRWTAHGGYSNVRQQADTQGSENRHREALFFSPHCLVADAGQGQLFGASHDA